jgi:hypothetical protein
MQDKVYASLVLMGILFDKSENKDRDFFDISWEADAMLSRQPTLKNNLEKYWKDKPRTIPKDLLIKDMQKLIKFIKKFPISDRKYFGHGNGEYIIYPAYDGWVHKEDVDFIDENLEKYIGIFCRDIDFITGGWRHFHYVESHVLSGDEFKKKFFRKRKLKSKDFSDIQDVIRFFKERFDYFNKEKKYFSNKRLFKKSKKQLFVFHVTTKGSYWSIDWSYSSENDFYIIVSHIDEQGAKDSLISIYSNNLVQGIIKKLSKNKIDQLNIKDVTIERVEANQENILKAKDNLKARWNPSYNNYGSFFKS